MRLSQAHLYLLAPLTSYMHRDESMPNDEYVERLQSMMDKADEIANLAKDRLAELDG